MKKILLFVIAGLLTVTFTVPAMAKVHYKPAENQVLTLYGHVVFGSFYTNQNNPTEEDDSDLFFDLYGDSRIGGDYESGDIYGNWQFGLTSGTGETSVYLRQIFGTWTISEDMSITIGQKLSPYIYGAYSGAAGDNGGTGYGTLYDGFTARVTLNYKAFYIDAAKPNTSDLGFDDDDLADPLALDYDYDDDVKFERVLPRIAVGYDYSSEGLNIGGGVGYNTFKMELKTSTKTIFSKKTISSWVAFLHGDVALTDMLKLRAAGWYGVNPVEYGVAGLDGPIDGGISADTVVVDRGGSNEIKDTTTFAGHIELHADMGKAVARVGYGYASSDNDTFAKADAHQEYWVNTEIPIFKGVHGTAMSVQPEVHIFDQMKDKDGNEEPTALYVGARWNLDF